MLLSRPRDTESRLAAEEEGQCTTIMITFIIVKNFTLLALSDERRFWSCMLGCIQRRTVSMFLREMDNGGLFIPSLLQGS